jgi:mRNA interferase MazF
MIRGDVYWHKFKQPDKKRPVVILTRNILIPELNVLTVAPITTTMRETETQVFLDETDGLKKDSAVNLTNIQTIEKNKLGSFITHLSLDKMFEIAEAIKFSLQLDAEISEI